MSELLFNRAALVTFLAPNQDDRSFEGLRVAFDLEKTIDDTPNSAKISIYNLTDASRSYIQQKNSQILLAVGYQGVQPEPLYRLIFRGNITKVKTQNNVGDIITSIEAADGLLAYTGNTIDQSFAPGATVKQVFAALSKAMGLPLGEIQAIEASNKQFTRGYSVSGLVRDELKRLTERTSTEWSIQDGSLTVFPKGSGSNVDIVNLTPETGLLGIPNKGEDGKIEFKTLLDARIKPGQVINLDSQNLKGLFYVTRVKHQGDSHDGPWMSECEAI